MNSDLKTPLKGEIWLINWNPSRGSEQAGIRPSLIIQNNIGNKNSNFPNTIVVTISTKGRDIPFHVKLIPNKLNGLSDISYIKTEQILTISKNRLIKKIGQILDDEYLLVNKGLKLVLDL
ncbi:MAG: type II toxin-antitoxin system PemK/MazF family toxin [Nanoarchaeota archaeon]|nr:type II toxin-antitoxin system PemK/MazF family toxin [Nanoarchaeota archaeon]